MSLTIYNTPVLKQLFKYMSMAFLKIMGWKVDPNWRGDPLPVGTALTDSAPYSSDDGSASVPLKRPRPLPTGASAAAAAVTASPAATAVPATSPPTAAPSALTMPARAAHQAALHMLQLG